MSTFGPFVTFLCLIRGPRRRASLQIISTYMIDDNLSNLIILIRIYMYNSRLKLTERLLTGKRIKRNAVNCLRDPNNIRVIVITLPKTGTTTLAVSFQRAFNGRSGFNNVIHGHSNECIHKWIPFLKPEKIGVRDIIDFYNWKHPGKKAIVLHSYREPISRLISGYFQNNMSNLSKDPNTLKASIVKFLETLVPVAGLYKEYSDDAGTPLFQIPYNHELGYSYKELDRCHLINTRVDKLMNLEKLVKTIDPQQFKNFKIVEANVQKNALYDVVKKTIVVPKEIIDKHYENEKEYLTYYYKPEDIMKMKDAWYSRSSLSPPLFF